MKTVLVPTDFGPAAKNAVRYALALAQDIGSRLLIYHSGTHSPGDLARMKEAVATTNKQVTQEPEYLVSHQLFSSLNLNDLVKERSIDLVIMGTSGEDAPAGQALFGHQTTEISEHADYPVIAVPPEFVYNKIHSIAYASDLSFIEREIGKVIEVARAFGARIEVFHVSPVYPDLGDVETMDVVKKLNDIKSRHGFQDIKYTKVPMKRDNQVRKGIRLFLSEHTCDLVVMFHNHLNNFDELISRSTISKLIPHLKTPLLVLPKELH